MVGLYQLPAASGQWREPDRIHSMGTPKSVAMIPPAQRLAGVNYSIRRVAVEGKKTEAAEKKIYWLNTGDPITAGFHTPAHMIAAVERSLRYGENGYGPSSGL